ncbi:hypothetical protein HGRIS_012514 [Hohenbuehelia grisea]|uniref:Cytochrome P450 n=1 Tax=Hohenbuehelia grisea TaxID=104357 RepID=A0ABR3ISL7_9AGAR
MAVHNAWAALAVLLLAVFLLRRTRSLPRPPGPNRYPLIGSLLTMPKDDQWITFNAWSQEFNCDLIYAEVLTDKILVVNSYEAAHELLGRKSSPCASRPQFTMLNELIGWGWLFAFMPNNETWRRHRHLFERELNASQKLLYQPQIEKCVPQLLLQLLREPVEYVSHLRHLAGSIIMLITYGIEVLPEDDPYIATSRAATESLTITGTPGNFMVDFLPWLKYFPAWVPGAGFQARAKNWRGHVRNMIDLPFNNSKREAAAPGKGTASFTSICLDKIKPGDDDAQQEEDIKLVATTSYAGGSDTTVSALQTFVLAMLLYPEVQLKAQQELDALLSRSRLPNFEDRDDLPYFNALIKEVLRWEPVNPLGLPHLSTKECTFRGFHLPANTVVLPNAWAMSRDEVAYPESRVFKPERFLTDDGKPNPHVQDSSFVFGFGPRVCPGKHIATSTLWLAAASILCTMNITKVCSADGKVIEPSAKYYGSIVRHPEPFVCSIKPRSKETEELIYAAVQSTDP